MASVEENWHTSGDFDIATKKHRNKKPAAKVQCKHASNTLRADFSLSCCHNCFLVLYARVRVKQLSLLKSDVSQVNRINAKEVLLYSRCINFKDLTVNMVHNTLVIQCDENIIPISKYNLFSPFCQI